MRRHGWAWLVVWGGILVSGPRAPAREALSLVVEAPLATPAEQALGMLAEEKFAAVAGARAVNIYQGRRLPKETTAVIYSSDDLPLVDSGVDAHLVPSRSQIENKHHGGTMTSPGSVP